MRKLIIVAALMAAFPTWLNAQNCPTASFSIPDTICSATAVPFTNNTTGGTGPVSYNWNFCPPNIQNTPILDTALELGALSQYGAGIDLVMDNGNWYGFMLNSGNNTITRLDYGNSLLNAPVAVDIGNAGGICQNEMDIRVIEDNNNWYLFICKQFNEIVRIDLGSDITNPAVTGTLLTIPPGFINLPLNMTMVKDHGEYKILTANLGSASITVVNIGSDVTNINPAVSNLPNVYAAIYSLTVVRDCDRWYGVTVSVNLVDVNVIDFGDSITSTPLSSVNLGTGTTGAYDIELVNEGGKWYGFALGPNYQRIDFGTPLNTLNPPIVTLPVGMGSNEKNLCLKKDGAEWVGITTHRVDDSGYDLRSYVITNNCNSNIPSSTDSVPQGILFTGTGFQNITLTVTDSVGNPSTVTDSVYVIGAPTSYFTHSPGCIGLPVYFTDSSYINGNTISSWSWNFGDSTFSAAQSPAHTYNTPGNYAVTLQATSANGCVNSYIDTVSVSPLPVAALTVTDSVCARDTIQFSDASSSTDPIAVWSWSFGDSTASALSNPQHSYQDAGLYQISLTVVTGNGCSSTASDSIFIRPKPLPEFFATNTCIGETVSFINLSTISDSSNLNYSWNFGDLTGSNQPNPSHSYSASVAVYNVSLVATSPDGCTDSIVKPIRIGNKPEPAFNMNPATLCKGNNVSFTDLSFVPGSDPGDTINTWLWDFGDSTISTIQNPVHVYADTGIFIVTLTVTSPTSCDSSVSQTVTVIDAPDAAFNYSDVCLGDTNIFIDFSSAPQGSVIISRSWDFGDSTSGSGSMISHFYAIPGNYNVVLTVTDTFGCTDFVMHQVHVHPLPVAGFTNGIACTGTPLLFTNQSTIASGDTITFNSWDFGDGGTSSLINPSHPYSTFGQKQVTLIVSSSFGCSDTVTHTIFVNQSPLADFTYSQTCLGAATEFNYLANPFPSTINLYNWSFGDLAVSTDENPVHLYASAFTYTVSVTVVDNSGCTATATHPVIIDPIPVADFSYPYGCEGYPVSFIDSSSVVSGSIISHIWNFGNGFTDTVPAPQFQFDSAGTYSVSLVVATSEGCTDSISKPVTVSGIPAASFTQNYLVGTPPLTVTFTNTSTGAASYFWDFGNGTSDTAKNPVHFFPDTGIFTIMLVAFNQEGCSDTAYNSLTVLIPHVDLAVLNVNTTRQNNLLKISADVFNLGNIVINNFDISAQLEGGVIIHESYSDPLPPGLLKYDFHAQLETNQYNNPGYICVEVKNPNGLLEDANTSNDKMCTGNGSTFEIIDIYNDPSTGRSTIHFNLPSADDVTMELFDNLGKKLNEKISFRGVMGLNTYVYDTRTLSKGAYSCAIKFRDEVKSKRLLKF